jgi:hypothetical protein
MTPRLYIKSLLLVAPFVVFFICALLLPSVSFAADSIDPVRFILDAETIQKGFTTHTAEHELRVGVTPNAIGERNRARVALKQVLKSGMVLPEEQLLSPLFSYDIFHQDTIEVHQPIWLSIAWTTETEEAYVLRYWDGVQESWIELPSTVDEAGQRVQAAIHLPYAIIGVFEKEREEYHGVASWYDWHGASINPQPGNDFPMGTPVEVINPATGSSAITTIVSRGPYHPGRLIDLPREVFGALGSIGAGVMDVIVREYEPEDGEEL